VTTIAQLEDLERRLKDATGPDRELNARITYITTPITQYYDSMEAWLRTNISMSNARPPYTTSIDAALALVERMLPGYFLEHLGDNPTAHPKRAPVPMNEVAAELSNGMSFNEGRAPTRPLAILLALVAALKEKARITSGGG
jgi:hypothetical protein